MFHVKHLWTLFYLQNVSRETFSQNFNKKNNVSRETL